MTTYESSYIPVMQLSRFLKTIVC